MRRRREFARCSDGLVIQKVADLQNSREFQVVASRIQADVHWTSRFFVPPILSARSHRRIAYYRNPARQFGDLVHAVNRRYSRVDGPRNIDAGRSKHASDANQIPVHWTNHRIRRNKPERKGAFYAPADVLNF